MLDFGCGQKPYESLFSVEEYVGLDIEVSGHDHTNSKVDTYYDGKNIPLQIVILIVFFPQKYLSIFLTLAKCWL